MEAKKRQIDPTMADKGVPPPRPRFGARWLVLGLLVAGHAAFAALLTPFGASEREYPRAAAYAVMGVLLVQPLLLAMWAALAPQPFHRRFPVAALACVLVSCAQALAAARYTTDYRKHGMNAVVTGAVLFCLATLAFWLVRRFSGWQLAESGAKTGRSDPPRSQFSIKYLLAWTAATAAMLGLGRYLLAGGRSSGPDAGWHQSVGHFALAMGVLLTVLVAMVVVPWVTLAYRGRGTLLIPAAVIVWAFLTYGAISVLARIPPATFAQAAGPVVFGQLGAAAAGFVTALVARLCGYRMVRLGRAKSGIAS